MSRCRVGLPSGFSDNESSDEEDFEDLGAGSMAFNPYGSFAEILNDGDEEPSIISMAPPKIIRNRTEFFAQSPLAGFTGLDPLESPSARAPPMQPLDRELIEHSNDSPAAGGELQGDSPQRSPAVLVRRPQAVRAAKSRTRGRQHSTAASATSPSPGLSPFFESEVEAVLLGMDRLHMDSVMHQVEERKSELRASPLRSEGYRYHSNEEYSGKLRAAISEQNKLVSSCLENFRERQRQATAHSRAELSKYRNCRIDDTKQKSATDSLCKAAIKDFLAVSSLFSALDSRCKRIGDPGTRSATATNELQKCATTLAELSSKIDKLDHSVEKLEATIGEESILVYQQKARLEDALRLEANAKKLIQRAARERDQKQVHEKEQELEAKRKKVEEAKKKAEDERKAKEDAKSRAEEAAMAKEEAELAEEKKLADAQHAKERLAERLAEAKAKALENFSGTAKLSLSASAFEDYKKYTAAYEEVKDAARDISCMKPIKLVFNQVNADKQHTEQRTVALCGFFETVKNNPAKMAYCAKYFADQLVTKAEDVVRSKELTFVISYLALCVCSKFPIFGPVLKGKLYLSCSYTVPLNFKRDGFESEEAFLAAQGRSTSTDEEKHLKRMEGLVQLYACMNILTVPLHMDDGSYPFGMDAAWTWLARFGNLTGAEHSARMLMCFLQVAGFSLQQRYRTQFFKLVVYFGTAFFKDQILARPNLDKPSITRYQAFFKQFASSKQIPKFPGHDSFH